MEVSTLTKYIPGVLSETSNAIEDFKVQPDSRLIIYPNPASGIINVELSEACDNYEIEIYDISGTKIYGMTSDSCASQVNIESLSAGIYIVKVVKDDMIYQKRFLKK